MGTKIIRLVYDKKTEKLVSKLRDKVCFERYDKCVAFISVEVFGQSIIDAGIKLDFTIKSNYRYRLMFFRSKQELDEHKYNAPTRAKRLINRVIQAPKEPYELDIKRPTDFFVTNYFKSNTSYTGYWMEIDMNSAEPYYVMQKCPEMTEEILNMYYKRKKHPIYKLTLNCINGNLRNSHASIYKYVVESLYNKMLEVMKTFEKYGAIPFAMRRDAVICSVPKDFIIPEEIPIGDDIGQFKVKKDKGTIRTTSSEFIYYTNMKKITTKQSGTMKESYLSRLDVVCNKITGRGLVILKPIQTIGGQTVLVPDYTIAKEVKNGKVQ